MTHFDEPSGIAFASVNKAYVALSSTNEIAVVRVDGNRFAVDPVRIQINAQEPRAIAVQGGRLFVAAFESGNQTEFSNCVTRADSEGCTIGLIDPPRAPGSPLPEVNILRRPGAPDRDVFVFDTEDEAPVDVLSHVGTLLYGLAVDHHGRVYVSHTEARNHVNGIEGGTLADLENRIVRLQGRGTHDQLAQVRIDQETLSQSTAWTHTKARKKLSEILLHFSAAPAILVRVKDGSGR